MVFKIVAVVQFSLVPLICGVACQHSTFKKTEKKPIHLSKVGGPSNTLDTNKLDTQLVIPSEFLDLVYLKSPHVVLRNGPGSNFPIAQDLLQYGTQAIVLESKEIWKKIVTYKGLETGWVHKQQLHALNLDPQDRIALPAWKLQLLSLKASVNSVKSFDRSSKVSIDVNSRTFVLKLKQQRKELLVWLPNRNLVGWLAADQVL